MWFDVLLISVLAICVFTDLKERKIYNKVIFPALMITLVAHLIVGGLTAVGHSLLGLLVGLCILLIPYLMGGIGAGDVKLLALVGAIKGTVFVINAALFMALIGGLIALIVILFRKDTFERFKYAFHYVLLRRSGVHIPKPAKRGYLSDTYPYGVPIAGGALLALVLGGGII